jgi:hypothetical protein
VKAGGRGGKGSRFHDRKNVFQVTEFQMIVDTHTPLQNLCTVAGGGRHGARWGRYPIKNNDGSEDFSGQKLKKIGSLL